MAKVGFWRVDSSLRGIIMFDILSFLLGKKQGEKTINLESDDYTFTDDGDGNIEIEEGGGE